MSLEELEVNVAGTKFKGIYLAILLSFGSTLGGGIWAASEFFSRLESLEESVELSSTDTKLVNQRFEDFREVWTDDKKTIVSDLSVTKQQIEDASIDELQGKLATLGTNLQTIMDRQKELISMGERIVEVEKQITETQTLVQKAETMMKDADSIQNELEQIEKEIEEIWEGMDYLANPYSGES